MLMPAGVVVGAAVAAAVLGLPSAHAFGLEPGALAFEIREVIPPDNLTSAEGVAFGPGGIIAVADTVNKSAKVFHPNGTFAFQFGSFGLGPGEIRRPQGVAFGPGGIIAVAGASLKVFYPDGAFAYQVGSRGYDPGGFGRDDIHVAFGPGGLIAVSDEDYSRVQVFHPNGTYAYRVGVESRGSGPGELRFPSGVDFGPGGIMAVADRSNDRVQVFHPNGTFAFQFGSIGYAPGEFRGPEGVAFGPGGIMAVADEYNNRVQVFHPNGTFAYQVGSGPKGEGGSGAGNFSRPVDVAFGPGGIMAVAADFNRVLVFHPPSGLSPAAVAGFDGDRALLFSLPPPPVTQVLSVSALDVAGTYGAGSNVSITVQFTRPVLVVGEGTPMLALSTEPPRSAVHVADADARASSAMEFVYAVQPGDAANPLDYDGTGALYVNGSGVIRDEYGGDAVLRLPPPSSLSPPPVVSIVIDTTTTTTTPPPWGRPPAPAGPPPPPGPGLPAGGTLAYLFGSHGQGLGEFYAPRDVAFGPGGIMAVADTGNHRIQVFHPNGTLALQFGSHGQGPGELGFPHDVAFGPGGIMAVADTGNHRVQIFRPDGTFAFVLGAAGAAPGEFYYPKGLAFGPDGLLAVSDMGNSRVQVLRIQ